MWEWIGMQMDVALMLQASSMLFLALLTFVMVRHRMTSISWNWLAISTLLFTLFMLLELLLISFGKTEFFTVLNTTLFFSGSAALIEFALFNLRRFGRGFSLLPAYLLAAAVLAFALWHHWFWLTYALEVALYAAGFHLCFRLLVVVKDKYELSQQTVRIFFWISLVSPMLATLNLLRPVLLQPIPVLNHIIVIVNFFLAGVLFFLDSLVWTWTWGKHSREYKAFYQNKTGNNIWPLPVMAAVLLLGWGFVTLSGSRQEQRQLQQITLHLKSAALSLSLDCLRQPGNTAPEPAYNLLNQHLSAIRTRLPQVKALLVVKLPADFSPGVLDTDYLNLETQQANTFFRSESKHLLSLYQQDNTLLRPIHFSQWGDCQLVMLPVTGLYLNNQQAALGAAIRQDWWQQEIEQARLPSLLVMFLLLAILFGVMLAQRAFFESTLAKLQSEDRFQSLFSNIEDAFFYCRLVMDHNHQPTDFIILDANSTFMVMSGLKHPLAPEQKGSVLIPAAVTAPWLERFNLSVETGKSLRLETYVDFLGRWCSVAIYSPHPPYFACMFEDITVRRAISQEIVDAKHEVEKTNRQLAEINRELETAYNQANALAHESQMASVAKTQFLTNMSHEIRTPLTGLLGMLELLETTPLEEKQKYYLNLARISSEGLLRVLNDILDISKIEAGKLEIMAIEFKLRSCLSDCLHPLKFRAQQKKLAFQISFDKRIPKEAIGDSGRLRQIVINLVSNAIKFTHHGKVSVQFELANTFKKPVGFLLHGIIADTGPGVPPGKEQEIFKPFIQADGSFTREYGGTGLGLTISRELAERMGGRVWFENQAEGGCAFHFTIQLGWKKEAVWDMAPFEPAAGLPVTSPPTKKILWVEDNEVNQIYVGELLTKNGFQVVIAENGQEALERFEQENFQLVLTDVQMQAMDGLALAAAIRSREAGKNQRIPILGLTAHSMKGDQEKCLAAGMDAYLSKPIHGSEIVDKINDWLRRV